MNTTQKWKDYIQDHLTASKKSAAEMSLAIQNTPLKYEIPREGKNVTAYTRTLQIPKIFTQTDKRRFETIAGTMTSIFDKTIDAYKSDPEVRRLFQFDPVLEEMIMADPGYEARIPILRVDIFYNEDDGSFAFCEFNTDGTSAMFENDTMKELMPHNNVWNHFQPDVEYMELMEPWIDAFLADYAQSENAKEKPAILITDFLENAYRPELYAFEKAFRKRGYVCEVEDIRNLDYDGKQLFSRQTGTRYDAVYRRAVTRDVMEHLEEIQPFLKALKEGRFVLIGNFQTQVVHSKMINEALMKPELQKYFTPEEIAFLHEHLPETFDLNRETMDRVLENKNNWIIKPRDSYAAKGVWAGVDVSRKQWERLIHDYVDADYIVQKYIHHYQSENFDLLAQDEPKEYSNMTGLYIYNGKFAGVYSRLSDAGIISSQYNEKMVPTFFLKEETEQEAA